MTKTLEELFVEHGELYNKFTSVNDFDAVVLQQQLKEIRSQITAEIQRDGRGNDRTL